MNLVVNNHNIFLIVLVTFLSSLLLVPIFNKVARHVNALDYPDNKRKLQKVIEVLYYNTKPQLKKKQNHQIQNKKVHQLLKLKNQIAVVQLPISI